jgi:hypothetical protein
MIGTTRSRVSFFMNRFRKPGFVDYEYHGRIRVYGSLLNVVLKDGLPGRTHDLHGTVAIQTQRDNRPNATYVSKI